jgi:hypothetical protein
MSLKQARGFRRRFMVTYELPFRSGEIGSHSIDTGGNVWKRF